MFKEAIHCNTALLAFDGGHKIRTLHLWEDFSKPSAWLGAVYPPSSLDRDGRLQLKAEMGHGPDRDDVVSVYLGGALRFWVDVRQFLELLAF